jgi:hypothetical protein
MTTRPRVSMLHGFIVVANFARHLVPSAQAMRADEQSY